MNILPLSAERQGGLRVPGLGVGGPEGRGQGNRRHSGAATVHGQPTELSPMEALAKPVTAAKFGWEN
jgi:hypothetical protein